MFSSEIDFFFRFSRSQSVQSKEIILAMYQLKDEQSSDDNWEAETGGNYRMLFCSKNVATDDSINKTFSTENCESSELKLDNLTKSALKFILRLLEEFHLTQSGVPIVCQELTLIMRAFSSNVLVNFSLLLPIIYTTLQGFLKRHQDLKVVITIYHICRQTRSSENLGSPSRNWKLFLKIFFKRIHGKESTISTKSRMS